MERRCNYKSQWVLYSELCNARIKDDHIRSMEKRWISVYNFTRKHYIELISIKYEKLKPLIAVAFLSITTIGQLLPDGLQVIFYKANTVNNYFKNQFDRSFLNPKT